MGVLLNFCKLLPTQPCENKHIEACPIMIDAPALRDTGPFTSHQHHAVEKAFWFGALHSLQTNVESTNQSTNQSINPTNPINPINQINPIKPLNSINPLNPINQRIRPSMKTINQSIKSYQSKYQIKSNHSNSINQIKSNQTWKIQKDSRTAAVANSHALRLLLWFTVSTANWCYNLPSVRLTWLEDWPYTFVRNSEVCELNFFWWFRNSQTWFIITSGSEKAS